ncbi:undecaprenyldiphospho-muramoylpentapeptide beta-N-acetylglucosaminyltransferase [Myxacorys almedinensis A]|uniref:UDP-N-acetylglucosamine--N-acetylmuramyl-(pentapeptide) pyrophosphoryl-undecaprenol N-acetylglucosamine transferase n=1 Tax=Myxacorys almedinensis A TaxID=2690445 RepID=A0A8J7Z4B1_9CYAN|nr:undecaprenyldiphospho-muramoylpentapeptide beta-N-acetylglucosaminyltransferase [Myxacorys almedinensis A]
MRPPTLPRLLIAASGTGGHLFPAIATAEQLADYQIEWLGVPDRLETKLVSDRYRLHTVKVGGFQQKLGLGTLKTLLGLMGSVFKVRKLLREGQFSGVFTTGGYIAGPALFAARSLGLPVILHESNALPGKVTRLFAPWCSTVALGFESATKYLKNAKTICVGTPVRSQFRSAPDPTALKDLAISKEAPLIVVVGGSQGAVALNQLVRQCAPAWFEAGAWVVHITGESDPDLRGLAHPHYRALPFYHNMAALFQRANLAISRAGAGTLTELAVTHTPSILIPYPFAAEDHQTYNATVFANAGAAILFRQSELTPDMLQNSVLTLLKERMRLDQMAERAAALAVIDSAEQTAQLVRDSLAPRSATMSKPGL